MKNWYLLYIALQDERLPHKDILMAVVASKDSASRFFNLSLVPFRGRFVPDISEYRDLLSSIQDDSVVVIRPNRLDIIAESVYNDPQLFWVIAVVNNIADPFDVPEGTVLRLPSIEFVTMFASSRI